MKADRKTKRRAEAELADPRQQLAAANRRIAEPEATEDRRESAAALADTHEQIELIVDTLPVLLAYIDTEQRYLYVNRLYAEWYGLAREEIVGKRVRDVLHKATYQKALPAIKAALNGQRITYENDAAYDVQGRPHTVRATYVPHLDENGQARAFLAMVEDITEHVRSEEERAQAEREIQNLAKFPSENPNPVLRVSGEGTILYANQAGFPLLDAWGCRESRRLPDEWREIVSRSLDSGSRDQVETQCDGCTLLLAIAPVAEAAYANVYGLDITERKQAEERVKHLNAVLRAIRDVSQLIVREKDRGRLVQGVCDTLVETRGYHNAWIALLDESGALEAAAEAGLGDDFPLLVERLERGEPTYCMRRALAQANILAVENPPSTCIDCPLSNKYSGRGGMATRIEHAGEVYGLLVVSTSGGILADEEEQGLFEEVARDIALALHDIKLEEEHKRAEEALQESEEKYRLLFENMMNGFALHEIVVDEKGEPVDYVFLEANSAFERLTGLGRDDLIGRKVTEVIPGIEKDPADWIGQYGQVALTGQEIRFVQLSQPLGRWYSVSAFSPRKGQFATIFEDFTERKQAEAQLAKQLDELRRWHAVTLGRETRILDLKREVNELLAQAGQPPRYLSANEEDPKGLLDL